MFLDILSDFLALCPALKGRKLTQNYLSQSLSSVSLISVANSPVLKSYTDGGGLYQTVFKLVLREPFDQKNNFSSLYSSFLSWVESVNNPSALPSLYNDFSPVSLSVLKSGEVSSSSPSFSEFEILCRFTYSK